MKYYKIYPSTEPSVKPLSQWHITEYAAIACSKCHAITMERRDRPIHVHVDQQYVTDTFNQATPDLGHCVSVWDVHVEMVSRDLVDALDLHSLGFHIGRVFINGGKWERYRSVLASNDIRVRVEPCVVMRKLDPCAICGRVFRQIDFAHGFWVYKRDIDERDVFADDLGTIIVSNAVITNVDPSISSALKLSEIEVR